MGGGYRGAWGLVSTRVEILLKQSHRRLKRQRPVVIEH